MRNPVLAIVFVAAVGYGFFNALGHGRSDKPMAIPAAAPGASQTAPRAMTENVVAYSIEDKAMQAAKNKGHSTLPRFHELMAAGTPEPTR